MNLKDLKLAWLSPAGKFVTDHKDFDPGPWHENLASCVLMGIWKMKDIMDVFCFIQDLEELDYEHKGVIKHSLDQTSTDCLEALGWIRLNARLLGDKHPWIISADTRLTKKQDNALLDWCNENACSFNELFSNIRF